MVMNPGGVSAEATARLEAMQRGAASEAPMPDTTDHQAIAKWRSAQHALWGEGAVSGEIEHHPVIIAGRHCLVAGPEHAPPVLHLHAGGFSLGSPGTDVPITARLARVTRVISLDYQLAPEHPFPAALDDVVAVYAELAAAGPIPVCGISAGGNLAVALALSLSPQQIPTRLALMCPHVDFGGGNRELLPHESAYLAGHDATDPLAVPAEASEDQLRRLPPMLIQATSDEPMWPGISRFARRAEQAGADVTLQQWQGLWHAWQYHRELPEAHDAVDRVGRWLGG